MEIGDKIHCSSWAQMNVRAWKLKEKGITTEPLYCRTTSGKIIRALVVTGIAPEAKQPDTLPTSQQ